MSDEIQNETLYSRVLLELGNDEVNADVNICLATSESQQSVYAVENVLVERAMRSPVLEDISKRCEPCDIDAPCVSTSQPPCIEGFNVVKPASLHLWYHTELGRCRVLFEIPRHHMKYNMSQAILLPASRYLLYTTLHFQASSSQTLHTCYKTCYFLRQDRSQVVALICQATLTRQNRTPAPTLLLCRPEHWFYICIQPPSSITSIRHRMPEQGSARKL
jgi:hypothetical protein